MNGGLGEGIPKTQEQCRIKVRFFSNERYSDVVHGKIAEIILERLEQRVHLHKLKSCLS